MTKVLGNVYRTIASFLTHKAGFAKPMAQTGAVTLILHLVHPNMVRISDYLNVDLL